MGDRPLCCALGILYNLKMTVWSMWSNCHNNWRRLKSCSAWPEIWSCPGWSMTRVAGCLPCPVQRWWIKTILCAVTLWVVKLTEQYLVMTLHPPPSSLLARSAGEPLCSDRHTSRDKHFQNTPHYKSSKLLRGSAVEMFLDFQIGDCYRVAFFV